MEGNYIFDNPFLRADCVAVLERVQGKVAAVEWRLFLDLFNSPLDVRS
jgi:hypothetical protein